MRKTLMLLSVVFVFVICMSAVGASAAVSTDFDFLTFAREKVLPDFHPTVKVEEATAEYDKEPARKDEGVINARVRIFYKGWIRKHEMVVDIDLRPEAELVKATVKADTNGVNLSGAKIFKENIWIELSSLETPEKTEE